MILVYVLKIVLDMTMSINKMNNLLKLHENANVNVQ